MGAQLTKQTRGCGTTGLFWGGQERLLGWDSEFPLHPWVCSHLPALPSWPTGREQSHECPWVGSPPIPHTLICCSKRFWGPEVPLGLLPTPTQRGLGPPALLLVAMWLCRDLHTMEGLGHPMLHPGMAVGTKSLLEPLTSDARTSPLSTPHRLGMTD